jgi:hypothetical protein
LTHIQHLRALTKEIADETDVAAKTIQGRALIKKLQANIENILNPSTSHVEEKRVRREDEQRVIDNTPIITIPRITTAEPILQSRNPTAKRALKNTPRIHGRVTRNNTPGAVPMFTRAKNHIPHGFGPYDRNDPVLIMSMSCPPIPPKIAHTPTSPRAKSRIISQQAIRPYNPGASN